MKILIVVTSMRMGGAEKLLAETIPKYGEAGFEITLWKRNFFQNCVVRTAVKSY